MGSINKKIVSKKLLFFLRKFPMNITAKILPAHYYPNIILFKIFNRINQNFGVTIMAVDLKLLRKNKIGLPIIYLFFKAKNNMLIFFGPMDTAQKLKKIKKFEFQHFTEI